jgi:hypothetical protein
MSYCGRKTKKKKKQSARERERAGLVLVEREMLCEVNLSLQS